MEAYSHLNQLLVKQVSTFQQFQSNLKSYAVQQQTYLNLFLVTVVTHRAHCPDFQKYVDLLIHFQEFTGKKSANINYIGYKDRKNVLMHACQRGTPKAIQNLLEYNIQWQVRDPVGKSMIFYTVRNTNQDNCNAILILLLNRFPQLLTMQAVNGETILNQAVDTLRLSTIELLLRRGANPNVKLKDTGNTVSHQLLKRYQNYKEVVLAILLLLVKYKANFCEANFEGVNVLQKARNQGVDIQNYASFCDLLQKDESVFEQNDNEFDKISLTTLNQITKAFDTTSQNLEMDSHILSGKVDFSQFDQQSILNQKDNQDHSEEIVLQSSEGSIEIQRQFDFQVLSQEILELSEAEEKVYAEMVPLAEPFFHSIDKIAKQFNLTIDIVGSFATGLWTPRSDIDISLIPRTNEFVHFEPTIQKIFKKIKVKKPQLGIEDIYFTKGKVNCIKVVLGGKFNGQLFKISVFHRNHLNKQYATYITQSLDTFPAIKPLFFVYKKMCQRFGLHDPQAGGLKTYALFLIISSVVKSMPTTNIGALFYHIAMYYGFSFEYPFDQGKQIDEEKHDIINFPPMRFNLLDPFNPRNNVGGKNTKTQRLRNMFRGIYYWMQEGGSQPYLQNMFNLQALL